MVQDLHAEEKDFRSRFNYPPADVQAALRVISSKTLKHHKHIVTHSRPNLVRSNIQKAVLKGANLEGFSMQFARCEGVDLRFANLKHTNLFWIRLDGALVGGLSIEGANLAGANLVGLDFEGDEESFVSKLQMTFGDKNTILPRGFERPQHWVSDQNSWQDIHISYYRWRQEMKFPAFGGQSAI